MTQTLLGGQRNLEALQLHDAIEQIRGAVVQMTYTIAGLPRESLLELGADGAVFSRPFGSGFFVSADGHVITAKHVLDQIEDFAIDYPGGRHVVGAGLAFPNEEGEGVGLRGTFRVIKYEVVDVDERNDVALLHLMRNPFKMPVEELTSSAGQILKPSVARIDAARPREGVPAAVSGYPLDQASLVTTAGHIASAWAADIKNQLVPDGDGGYAATDIADRYVADIQTNSGNSGGPAYLVETGAVIGVLTNNLLTAVVGDNSLRANAGLGELVPATYVADLATRNGVSVRTSSAQS